jgi:hypothetical protein
MTFPGIGVIFPPGDMARKLLNFGSMIPKYFIPPKNMTPRAVEVEAALQM